MPPTHQRPVVLVSHGFQSNYERGFTNGLAANGVDVTLISSDRTDYAGLLNSVRTANFRGSQEEHRSSWAKLHNMLRYHALLFAYALRWRHSTFHVIGLIDPPLLCGVVQGLWFRLVCWRYVLTVHDLLPHDRHTRLSRMLYALSFKMPSFFVVHTEKMRDQLITRHNIKKQKIVVMEHGLEPLDQEFSWPARPTSGAPLRILFFGNVARYKGIDVLLAALEHFEIAFTLLIAGTARDSKLEQELKEQIATHPYAGAITWRNEFVPETETQALFVGSDVLAMPYRHIDQSGVLFQALRFGLPIVATRVGAFERYVSNDIGELCAAGSADDLRLALQRFSARKSGISRNAIMERGRAYEWPSTVRALQGTYGAPSAA